MSGGSRAARGDEVLRQLPRAGSTSPAPTHMLRMLSKATKFLIIAHPPICVQVDGGLLEYEYQASYKVAEILAEGMSPA